MDLYELLYEVDICMGRGPRQGLSVRPGQNKVLKTLCGREEGQMPRDELLERIGVGPEMLDALLQQLEQDGLVELTGGGTCGRPAVSVTEQGRVAALESELSQVERDVALFGGLDAGEREDLVRILNKLLAAWDARDGGGETAGQRRERRWRENAQLQAEQREVNELLARVAAEAG